MADVDRFIVRYFATRERRASPRAPRPDQLGASTFEQAQAAERWYTHAIAVIGAAERRQRRARPGWPTDMQVLGRAVLGLSNAHRAVFWTAAPDGGLAARETVEVRGAPPDDADVVVSYVDWAQMARDAGLPATAQARRQLRDAFRRARAAVAEILQGVSSAA